MDKVCNREIRVFASICWKFREKSQSGGVLPVIARWVIDHQDWVVGCVWDKGLKAKHIMTHNWDVVQRMRKSKYVTSYLGNIYKQVKKKLDSGEFVFFTGTGCQVRQLYIYLGQRYDNLLTCNVWCHGTVNPRFLKDYIEGELGFDMNDCESFEIIDEMGIITMTDGNVVKMPYYECSYWVNSIVLNKNLCPACLNCEISLDVQPGDITIGDLHYAKSLQEYSEISGRIPSFIIFNKTFNNPDLFDYIKEQCEIFDAIPYEYITNKNRLGKIFPENS